MKPIEAPSLPATVVRWLPVWALLALGAAPAPADEATGRAASERHTRMEAESGAWPWQVALVLPRGSGFRQFCGGSVIHPRWVLTAAHCVEDVYADDIQVLAGTQDLDEGGRRIDVKAIRVHPEYVDPAGSGNDIALLELARPAGVEEAVTLPDAVRSADVARPGVPATVIGWGLLRPLRCEPGSESGSFRCRLRGGGAGHFVDDLTGEPVEESDVITSRLTEVVVPLVGEGACLDAYPGAAIDGRTLCAGLTTGGIDSCQGDGGGPLVVRDGDEWVQVGVVSWGEGCAKPGKYGVYTHTGAFAEWMNETTGLALVASAGEAGTEAPASPPPPRGDRALLIGIDQYADSGLHYLRGAVNDPSSAVVAESALGHANTAGVRLEILPSSRVRLGEAVTIRVHSARPGHLLLVDVAADGTVTHLFPNRWSERFVAGAVIEAGRPVEIPSPYYGFKLRAVEPAGKGVLFAVVTEAPVSFDDLASTDRGFETVPAAPSWLLAIGKRLRDPLMRKDGTWTRTRRWSYARLDYEIVR